MNGAPVRVERFIRAVDVLTGYNRELALDENAIDYVAPSERRAFIRAVAKLPWDRQQFH